jgi:mRNA interferase MazF
MKRNDIVFIKCNAVANGSVQCFDRPAVIIQNNTGNTHAPTLIVAYLTSQIKRIDMPTHVVISGYQGLYTESMIMAEQLATVSKKDVMAVMDHLRYEDAAKLDAALMASLALRKVG